MSDRPCVSRRAVVVGAAAAGAGLAVAGCSAAQPATSSAAPTAAPAGTTLGPASEVPVGSAKIYDAQGVVVTQAAAGSYACFSAICPHQGCAVSKVTEGNIICPCHGSTFALDGSVTKGPAATGLASRPIEVAGDQITLA